MVQLGEKRDARVGTLSGGQKQRLAIACALVGDPDLEARIAQEPVHDRGADRAGNLPERARDAIQLPFAALHDVLVVTGEQLIAAVAGGYSAPEIGEKLTNGLVKLTREGKRGRRGRFFFLRAMGAASPLGVGLLPALRRNHVHAGSERPEGIGEARVV